MWVIVAACFVMFMQAGFVFLEIGFSRGKNAGTVVAKILTNFSIAAICVLGRRLRLRLRRPGRRASSATPASSCATSAIRTQAFPVMGISDATIEAKFFFQFVFCAVSLAIVWGTTLERIKFGVYIIYAIVFSAVIYPVGAHWVFGGGFLQTGDWLGTGIVGMQDFAGSTAVHLIGATGALAALLLLGPRKGKYGPDGKPRAIPGHNMPLFGLGVLILWLGWFGFNPGSTLGALDGRFPEVLIVTNLAAAAACSAAIATACLKTGRWTSAWPATARSAALVAITAPSGYVELWAAPIDRRRRRRDRPARRLRDRQVHRRPGRRADRARPGRHLGHARVRPLHVAAAGPVQRVRRPGRRAALLGLVQAADRPGGRAVTVAFAFVFALSYATFWVIKKTYGLRVTEEEEDAGLDISEHGMYGYPEQFIPAARARRLRWRPPQPPATRAPRSDD